MTSTTASCPAASQAEIHSKVEQDLETGEFEAVSAETGGFDTVGR